ncbi:hypothetical protein V8F33_009729 [Rhypophila sp. PSN 637]
MVAHTIIPFVGGHLAKRFAGDEPNTYELPPWAFLVMLVNFAVLMIPLTWIHYTLGSLLPALAMVEDPNPPAYEPLASNDDVETAGTAPSAQNKNTAPVLPGADGKPVTSSIRRTHRLLDSVGGFRARFRGLMPAIASAVCTSIVNGIFVSSGLPVYLRIGGLFASLALVQLNTAWVHIIMTAPSPLSFWRRLPPFRRTFEATCFPVFANWAASTLAILLPLGTAAMLGLQLWSPDKPDQIPRYHSSDSWKTLLVWLVSVGSQLFLVLPAQVGLIRVQASLLNPEEPTIIPFDTTFQGTVGSAVVDGKGYVTLRDAIKTFSRASWIRLLKLYVKTFFISLAAYFVVIIAFIVQMVLLSATAKPVDGKN